MVEAKRAAPSSELTLEELKRVFREAREEDRAALVAAYLEEHLLTSAYFRDQLVALGLDPDAFWAAHQPEIVRQVLTQIEEEGPPGSQE